MKNNKLVDFTIKGVDLVTISGDNATVTALTPFPGKRFIPTQIIVDPRSVTLGGTPTAPHIVIDNGTNAQNFVADVALPTTKVPKALTVVTTYVVDHNNPLRIKKTTAAAASTGTAVYKADLIVIGLFL